MLFKKITIITIILTFLLAVSAVSAASDYAGDTVSTDSDNEIILEKNSNGNTIFNVPNGETENNGPDPKNFTELHNLINVEYATNDTIYLNDNYVYSNGDEEFVSGVLINRSLTIHGNGITIDGSHLARIFNITHSDVILNNINFINANATDDGGAITGICTVINSTFTNNSAGNGGAMYGGTAEKCVFTENHADDKGGAIYSGNAYGCVFINNTASQGGAIYGLSDKYSEVTLCLFEGNAPENVNVNINYPTFDVDSFISLYNSGEKLCFNLSFNGMLFDGYNTTITVSNDDGVIGTYYGLTGKDGGWVVNLTPGIYNATLSLDKYESSPSIIKITITDGTTFWDLNRTINGNEDDEIILDNSYSYHPDIDADFKDGIGIEREVTVNGNGHTIDGLQTARIFEITGNNVIIKNINLINGYSYTIGGAIYWTGVNGSISNSTFYNNRAYIDGGAVYWSGANGSIINSVFNNSKLSDYQYSDGGAVYWSGANGSISNSVFNNNQASRVGGAIYWSGDYGFISNSAFYDNQAHIDGGAVYWSGNYGFISNSSFNNNTCPVGPKITRGGAIRVESNFSINDCNFTNNSAGSVGGAIYFESNGEVFNSTFYENKVMSSWDLNGHEFPSSGGAIYISGRGVIANSKFYKNGGMKGTAIFSESNYLEVRDSEFLGNKAKLDTSNWGWSVSLPSSLSIHFGTCPNNYINAIYKENNNISLSNVTYLNGEIANSDDGNITTELLYLPVNLCISDGDGNIYYDALNIVKVTTSDNLSIPLDISLINFPSGDVTFNLTHDEDDYYYYFIVSLMLDFYELRQYSSSIEITTAESEFILGNCHINFAVENYTGAYIVITDEAGEIVFEKNITSSSGQFDPLISPQPFISHYDGSIFADLPASDGYYNITVYNLGTWQVIGCSDSKLFKILPVNSTVHVAALSESVYNNPIDVGISGENLTTVNVTAYDSNKNIVFTQNTTEGTISLPVLPVGQYNITVFNYGNQNISGCEDSTLVNILKANNNVVVSVEDVSYGNDAIIVITADADGEYSVNISGTVKAINVVNGVGNTSISLNAGEYRTNASFNNPNYESTVTNAQFNVNRITPEIIVTADPVSYGEDLVVNVVLPGDVSGSAIVQIGNDTKNVSLKNGVGSVKFSGLAAGTHDITASYNGDGNYDKAATNATVKVNKATPEIIVTASPVSYGEDLVVNVVLPGDVARRAIVNIDGGENKLVSLTDGVGSAKFSGLAAGTHDITVSYNGDGNYAKASVNATVKVKRAAPEIIVTAKDIKQGEDLIVNLELSKDVARRAIVQIGNDTKIVSLKDGVGSAKFGGLAKGTYNITVSYNGDGNYLKASVNATVNVNRGPAPIDVTANPVSYGEDVIIDVQLPNDVTRRVNITFGNISKLVSLKEGAASVKFSGLEVGTYDVTVSYGGDANYLKSSLNATVKVNKATPEIQITADDITSGETLVVGLQLPADVAKRAVVTIDGNDSLKKYASLKDGVGSVKFTGLAAGTHTIEVSYPGDAHYKMSSSTTIIEVKE